MSPYYCNLQPTLINASDNVQTTDRGIVLSERGEFREGTHEHCVACQQAR